MIRELERVDPSSLKHEEKLAFWLNIYNALMMHVKLLVFPILIILDFFRIVKSLRKVRICWAGIFSIRNSTEPYEACIFVTKGNCKYVYAWVKSIKFFYFVNALCTDYMPQAIYAPFFVTLLNAWQASYKIGPYSINAHTIEQYLLGCKSHRPAQVNLLC
jgi:hypothetical protein